MPFEMNDHSDYVQKMIQDDINKKYSEYLLNWHIEFHNKTCLSISYLLNKLKSFSILHIINELAFNLEP